MAIMSEEQRNNQSLVERLGGKEGKTSLLDRLAPKQITKEEIAQSVVSPPKFSALDRASAQEGVEIRDELAMRPEAIGARMLEPRKIGLGLDPLMEKSAIGLLAESPLGLGKAGLGFLDIMGQQARSVGEPGQVNPLQALMQFKPKGEAYKALDPAIEATQQRMETLESQTYQPETYLGYQMKGLAESTPALLAAIAMPTKEKGAALLGASSGGREFLEGLDKGTYAEALGSGTATGAAESIFSRLPLGNLSKEYANIGMRLVTQALSEGLEEAATEAVSILGKKLTYERGEELDWGDIVRQVRDAGVGGGLMGTIFGLLGNPNSKSRAEFEQSKSVSESSFFDDLVEQGVLDERPKSLSDAESAVQEQIGPTVERAETQQTAEIGPTVEAAKKLEQRLLPTNQATIDQRFNQLLDDLNASNIAETELALQELQQEANEKGLKMDLQIFAGELDKAKEAKERIDNVSLPEGMELSEEVNADLYENGFYEFEDMPDTAPISKVFQSAPNYKDVGAFNRWNTDVYRNFERAFGEDFGTVKESLLDPFDKAKGDMTRDMANYADQLYNKVVKKLGIKKGSEDSALVMRYGEDRITFEELKEKVGVERANKIRRANNFFRRVYGDILRDVNTQREKAGLKPLEYRKNYYRHYLEMQQGIMALKNILQSDARIAPELEGQSEFTAPNEKWQSIKQRFTGQGDFTEDAVGGFIDYIQGAMYSKHIDPQIKDFRKFRNSLLEGLDGNKNMNNFLGFLHEWTNGIAGKTNKFDRVAQDLVGRKAFSVVNWVNNRIKANAVVGNVSSMLAQVANAPNAIANIKNPVTLSEGLNASIQSIYGGGDTTLYDQSDFLTERYGRNVFDKFKDKWYQQPEKAAAWALEAGDEFTSKFMWSSFYRQAMNQGMDNPIKYADDMTRRMVGGRGLGEAPILQKSKLMQIFAPFTLEVNNAWKVIGDMGRKKDGLGLMILFVMNFIMNKVMEEIRGSGVVFDPIQAVIDGVQESETVGEGVMNVAGSLAGETISNVPMGASIGSAYPEYGIKVGDIETPTRKELFGEYDPTRYGTGLPILKAVQQPGKSLALPWGGGQVAKTIKGLQTTGVLPQQPISEESPMQLPASLSTSGKIRTFVEPTAGNVLQSALFGGYASDEVRDFFEGSGVPYSERQTGIILDLVERGYDQYALDAAMQKIREENAKKKADKLKIFNEFFTPTEAQTIIDSGL